MTTMAVALDAWQVAALADLRMAANDWSQAEFDFLRKQGLDRWAAQDLRCFSHWEIPLEGDPAGVQAHLTLQLSDTESNPATAWSLVWQVEITETGRWGRIVDQTELTRLDTAKVDRLQEGIDAILSLEPAQVLDWAKQMLLLRGYTMASRPRN